MISNPEGTKTKSRYSLWNFIFSFFVPMSSNWRVGLIYQNFSYKQKTRWSSWSSIILTFNFLDGRLTFRLLIWLPIATCYTYPPYLILNNWHSGLEQLEYETKRRCLRVGECFYTKKQVWYSRFSHLLMVRWPRFRRFSSGRVVRESQPLFLLRNWSDSCGWFCFRKCRFLQFQMDK